MVNRSLPTVDRRVYSSSPVRQYSRCSRHLHSGIEQIFVNQQPRLVIHVLIRSPRNNHRLNENQPINHTRDLHSVCLLIEHWNF